MEYRFIGREREMGYLEELYSRPGLKTCAVLGRRQIGKSTLLREFTKDKRTVFLQFSKNSYYENFCRLRQDLEDFLGRDLDDTDSFSDLMIILRNICREEPTMVVFDELPYLMEGASFVPSIIQRFIDADVRGLDCMVIICGSSVSMMRDAIEKIGSPLYGRFTDRLEVGELDMRQCSEFHRNMSDLDAIRTYLTVGGVPKYHLMMDGDTYEESLERCFLSATAPLRGEGEALTSEDERSEIYSAVVACISDGIVQQKTICERLGMDKGKCSRILREMEKLGFIAKRHPMAGAPRRPIYYIRDGMLAFWYDVIRRHRTSLGSLGIGPEKKLALIDGRIRTFLGRRFELLCMEYLMTEYDVTEIGSWWGPSGDTDSDIDVIATVLDDRMAVSQLIGECKFSINPMGFRAFNMLTERIEKAEPLPNIRYILFSASGFEMNLEEYAGEHGIVLVGIDKLLGRTAADRLEDIPLEGFVRLS